MIICNMCEKTWIEEEENPIFKCDECKTGDYLMDIEIEEKYLVWIGGTANVFTDKLDAECEAEYWRRKGYDDVHIEVDK